MRKGITLKSAKYLHQNACKAVIQGHQDVFLDVNAREKFRANRAHLAKILYVSGTDALFTS